MGLLPSSITIFVSSPIRLTFSVSILWLFIILKLPFNSPFSLSLLIIVIKSSSLSSLFLMFLLFYFLCYLIYSYNNSQNMDVNYTKNPKLFFKLCRNELEHHASRKKSTFVGITNLSWLKSYLNPLWKERD